jgi:hypothetical protein
MPSAQLEELPVVVVDVTVALISEVDSTTTAVGRPWQEEIVSTRSEGAVPRVASRTLTGPRLVVP